MVGGEWAGAGRSSSSGRTGVQSQTRTILSIVCLRGRTDERKEGTSERTDASTCRSLARSHRLLDLLSSFLGVLFSFFFAARRRRRRRL